MNNKFLSKIDVNDLPKYSSWPARLLGLADWETKVRNNDAVLNEYGNKWGGLKDYYNSTTTKSLSETIGLLVSEHFPSNLLCHIGEDIFYATVNDAFWAFYYQKINDIISKYLDDSDTLAELGCGWGRNLFHAIDSKWCRKIIGGEFTKEGRQLGQKISDQYQLSAEFYHFDYYNPSPDFMRKLKGSVIFTHNSIEQIAHMPESTIKAIIECKPKAVIHFEPVYEYRNNPNLLHLLWKRYTEINDYNRNLLTVLKKFEHQGTLKIQEEHIHALGLNAFNPGSFVCWTPNEP